MRRRSDARDRCRRPAGVAHALAGLALAALTLTGCSPGPLPSAAAASPIPGSPTPGSSATSIATDPPVDDATAPPLNDVERLVADSLGRLGLVARRAELSPGDQASMWVDVGDGRVLSVVTVPSSEAPADWTVISTRQVAGAEVRHVRNDEGFESDWIVCGANLVNISGTPPGGYDDIEAFRRVLVGELGCL